MMKFRKNGDGKYTDQKSAGITFTDVFDNIYYQGNLVTGWGFSGLVCGAKKTILFDTGRDGLRLLGNLRKLAIDPEIVDTIVLSHNHRDHTGGLMSFLELNSQVTIYIPHSFPKDFIEKVIRYGAEVVEISKSLEIEPDIYSSGELGNSIREQALLFKTKRGYALVTGCAHPGIVQIVRESKKLIDDNILMIFGGFHLRDNSYAEIENIIDNLKNLGVRYVGPSHCTGALARNLFEKEYGKYFIEMGTGKRIVFKDF